MLENFRANILNTTSLCDICIDGRLLCRMTIMLTMAVFMLEMLKLSKMLKPSRDDLTSSMKTSNMTDAFTFLLLGASQRCT